MPFNSSGVYTPAAGATTAAPGQIIASATWNSIHTDFSNALTLLGQQLYGSTSTATTPYVPLATDTLLLIDSTAGAITINLPLASSRNGYPLRIKDAKGTASSHNITINRNSSDTIDGLTSIKIASAYGAYLLFPVTTGWTIL